MYDVLIDHAAVVTMVGLLLLGLMIFCLGILLELPYQD